MCDGLFRDNVRSEVVRDAVSGENVGQVGSDVQVKYGYSRSNRSRDTQLPLFVTNGNDDAGIHQSSHQGKTTAFCLKYNFFIVTCGLYKKI